MAILIEEEKKRGGDWFGFGILFVVLIMLGVAAYYLFFVSPEIISSTGPSGASSIDELAQLGFEPKDVINSAFYKELKQVIPPISPRQAGNAAPFGIF